MTANEMSFEFQVGADVVASDGAPGYTDEEIGILLTKAQERFVKQKYTSKGNKYFKGFEGSEKRRKDLSELIRTANLTNADLSASQVDVHRNGFFYDLPADMLYSVSEIVTTDIEDCSVVGTTPLLTQIEVQPVTHDEYNININNPHKKPYNKLVWRLDYNSDEHELITDGSYGITGYQIRYLKKPTSIIVDNTIPINQIDSELDSSTHREIVDEAIKIAIGITKPDEYQIKAAENQQSE